MSLDIRWQFEHFCMNLEAGQIKCLSASTQADSNTKEASIGTRTQTLARVIMHQARPRHKRRNLLCESKHRMRAL